MDSDCLRLAAAAPETSWALTLYRQATWGEGVVFTDFEVIWGSRFVSFVSGHDGLVADLGERTSRP